MLDFASLSPMNWKKLAILDQFPYCASPQRKVVSGFGVGLVASLLFLSVVLFNVSFEAPFLSPMFRGFNTSRVNNRTSGVSLPLSFSNTSVFSSSTSTTSSAGSSVASNEELRNSVEVREGVGEGRVVDETQEVNVSVVSKKGDVLGSNGEGISLGGNNGSFTLLEGRLKDKTQLVNGSVTGKNANFTISDGAGVVLGTTHAGNSSGEVKNGSFSGDVGPGKSANDSSPNKNVNKVTENGNGADLSYRIENVGCPGKEVLCSHFDNQKISSEKNNITVSSKDNHPMARQKGLYGNCDIFDGRWVREDTERYYPAGSCPYIDRDFDCHLNGRKDDGFLKWKWKPYGCDIPSLNATDFLERLRGKKLVFVGDSLNRNMWESLVCILRQSVHDKKRVHEISGKKEFKKNGFYAFRYEDYNCTVDFVSAPFLVRESSFQRRNGSIETLRLDLMDQTTSMYGDADIVVFNTGHWWTHEKTSRGEDYYQEGKHVYPRLKVLEAYKRALTTWARWVDQNIDGTRTQVIYRGYSGTHFRGGQWNSGGKCHKETEPIFNKSFLAKYPSKMRVLEHILRKMKMPVIYLNISRLTDYRKDGHPSIYRQEYKTVEEQIAAEHSQDCSHWCLPGVPDTWNELLYASLLQAGKGSWRR